MGKRFKYISELYFKNVHGVEVYGNPKAVY